MKKVLVVISFVLIASLIVACDDGPVLESVYESKKTSSLVVFDWIDDNHYLCNNGIYQFNPEKSLLENKSIVNVSYVNSTWYVLYTDGTLETGASLDSLTSIGTNFTKLTHSGFYTTADTVYSANASTSASLTVRTAIESNGYLLVHDGSTVKVFDKNLSTAVSASYTDDVYGFVATKTGKFYLLTDTKIKEITSSAITDKMSYSPLIQPEIKAFALDSGAVVYQTEDGFSYTKDFTNITACSFDAKFDDVDDVVEIYRTSDTSAEKYIIATSKNGVYKVKLNTSGIPALEDSTSII